MGGLDLRAYKLINGSHRLLVLRLSEKKVIIIVECGCVSRENLVHLEDLVDGVAATSLVVKRLECL